MNDEMVPRMEEKTGGNKESNADEVQDKVFKILLEKADPADVVKISEKNVCMVTIMESNTVDQKMEDL